MNRMSKLVDKVERRLGTKPLNLPEEVRKDKWVDDCIIPDTLETFSRYFPRMVRIMVSTKKKTEDGYYLIDTDFVNGEEIIGIKDIAFDIYGSDSTYVQQSQGLGVYDYFSGTAQYTLDDVMMLQARADIASIFNNQTYVDFKEPNMLKVTSVTGGDLTGLMPYIPVDVFVMHPANLMTIPASQMEVFENLATADVANYLVAYLSHFDNLETVFANVDLKLDRLDQWAQRRDDIIQQIRDGYVNPANKNQPIMYTV
ncbi:MAG: hypothetical protein J6Y02_10090 [Pseudobutyrivibrio sp.]|nr:hypothetical protein [Pseudobutyrivibrio sp.]